jgi:hypothetical protein
MACSTLEFMRRLMTPGDQIIATIPGLATGSWWF